MVSEYDVLYSVSLNRGLTAAQIVKKLGRTSYSYDAIYKRLKQLENDGLVQVRNKKYFPGGAERTKRLVRLIDFCIRNGIDYNEIFLEKTAEFISLGLKKTVLTELPFDSKTIARISSLLSRHGFLLIESRKPLSARLVYSDFLKEVAELFAGRAEVKCKKIFDGVNEKTLNSQIEKEFSKFKKSSKQPGIEDEIRFIHRSLSLEGNTLSLPETERLIKESIPPKAKA
ncbi:hypothetical protein KKH30_03295, partial [Candidatus Micrarchaeota archaeon]|nr:hypothetical protein [Candidatus Micrarchaeota archaeon]MBU1939762.1 hypothetical protein [Candidatus Micrarchaeota archaeon]